MALKDCIKRLEKSGTPLTPKQLRALMEAKDAGLTDDQAVRKVALMAHQKVVDITVRARNEGATVEPFANPVSDVLQFQAKAMLKLVELTDKTNEQLAELSEEFRTIVFIEGYIRTRKTPSGKPMGMQGDQRVYVDLNNDRQVLDAMLQLEFRPDLKEGREAFGLEGKGANEMFENFRAMQARKQELIEQMHDLANTLNTKQQKVDAIFSGVGKQTFDQSELPRLTVLHNLSGENLQFSDEMGGLPLPSLALMPEGKSLDGMGEISLIGTQDLGDPSEVPVHDADAYTVTMPQPEYKKPKQADAEALTNELRAHSIAVESFNNPYLQDNGYRRSVDMTWEYLYNGASPDRAISEMLRSNGAKAWFLAEMHGESVDPVIVDVEPRYPLSWSKPMEKFFAGNLSAENLAWDDPKRVALYVRAGNAYKKALRQHYNEMFGKAGLEQKDIDEFFEKDVAQNIAEDGRLVLSLYDQMKQDQQKKGKQKVSDTKTEEVLDAQLKGREAQFQSWVHGKVMDVFDEPRIKLNGKWVPYNLENIVRKMKAAPLIGAEDTLTFGEGRARAEAAVRITSLQEARNRAEWQIATDEEVSAARDRAKELLEAWRMEVINFYGGQTWQGRIDTWNALDASMRAMARMVNMQMRLGPEKALKQALKSEEFGSVPDSVIAAGVEAATAWMEAPVPYFEAKPRRAVKLEEFAGAVIPSNASPDTQAILRKHGIPFKVYQVGEGIDRQASRAAALAEFTETLNNKGERTLFQSEIGFTSGLETAAKVMPREKGSPQEMLETLKRQPNVKQEEIDALGLEDWLEQQSLTQAMDAAMAGEEYTGKTVITREAMVKFIEAGGIQLQETYYQGEEKRDFSIASDELEISEEFIDPEFGPDQGLRQFVVYDRNDAFAEQFTMLVDEDAGNVSVRRESTGEWLEVDGRQNNQNKVDGIDAIEKVIRSQGIGPGAAGPVKWTAWTLPSPVDQFNRPVNVNHREIVLHMPEVGETRWEAEDLTVLDYDELRSVNETNEEVDAKNELMWYIRARKIDAADGKAYEHQVFQIQKSLHPTIEEAKQFILDEKKIEAPIGSNFESHAFKQKNIIAWMRVSDRMGAKGEAILFVEEVQSDLHQAGLTDGYNYTTGQQTRSLNKVGDLKVKAAKMLQNLDEPFVGFDNGREALNEYEQLDGKPPAGTFPDPFAVLSKKQRALMNRWLGEKKKNDLVQAGGPTPNMPWKGDAWAELAMKRIIRMAAEKGYDQVAWTTGEQQVARYDITEFADRIEWDPRDERLTTYDSDGRMIEDYFVSFDGLDEYIGAERKLELQRQIDDARRGWTISPVYLSSKQRSDMTGEELAFADAANDGAPVKSTDVGKFNLEMSPNDIVLDDIDQFIGTHERKWIEANGVAFALVDENGEMVRQSGGDYQMWEYYSGAEEAVDDFAFGNDLPTLRAVDLVDEEGRGLRKRYDQLMVNVTNRALKKLDKSAKVKRAGIQMEGGGTMLGQRIQREGGGNLVPGTVDPGAFYVEGWATSQGETEAERQAAGIYDRVQISPRFDTYEEAEAWHDNITLGFATTVHGFDLTAEIQAAAMEGQTYFQSKKRGQITFDEENRAIIRLAQSKDLSTFLHESAHLYLEMMGDLIDVTDVDPKLIDDYTTILKFLGVNNRYEIEKRHHELFARSFEAYLREGKSPTAELQPIFSAYSGWLKTVYTTLRKLLRPHEQLNDEIRGVFDRMVASEEAISQSEDMMSYVQLYQTAEEMGVSQEVFDVYKRDIQEEHDAEVNKLTSKSLKSVRWAKEAWWRDERKKQADQVREEAEKMPVYIAMAMLMRGKNPDGTDTERQPIKLDKKDLIARYGKEFIKRLPGRGKYLPYAVEGGTDADIAANIFGFEDADTMVKTMIDAPAMEEFIQIEADRRMKELHPDPLNDPEVVEDTAREIHTNKRAKILGAELRALRKKQAEDKAIVKATKDEAKRTDREAREANKAQLPKRENMAQIKAAAAVAVGKRRIRDIVPRNYLLAERKAGRLAFQAMERKDYAEAYKQKLAQIMNFEAYRAAVKAKDQAVRDHKYLTSFNKKSKKTRIAKAGYLERIFAILEGVDLRKISMKQIDREKLENELTVAIEAGDIVTTPEIQELLANPGGINWKDMTAEEFAGIRDVVKQLEQAAKNEYEIIINGEKQVIQEKVDEVAAGIIENNEQVDPILTSERAGGIKRFMRDSIGHWLRSSSIARVLDKSGFGAVTRNVIVPIRRAVTEKLLPWQHKASEDVAKIYTKFYSNKEMSKLGKKLSGTIMGQSWAKSDILALALHWGSEGGREAVLGGILEDAYGNQSSAYTQQGVAEALALMDARDWEFVQAIWDYQNSYWEQLAETERRRRGFAPEKVESLPFEIRTSDGQTVNVRGGYHHLQYMPDTGKSGRDEAFEEAYKNMQNSGFLSASTRAGATYNRVKKHGRVVKLTLNTVDQNLREILRDMAIGDEVNMVNRILQSREVRNAMKNTNNAELLTELKLWLSDAAVGELPAQSSWEKAISWFRVGFTKSKLAFNVYVTLLQLTGAFQSMASIGTVQYMRGVGQFLKDPVANWKMVQEKSTFMNARYGVMQAFDKDVADTRAFLQAFFGGVPTKLTRGMDTMAHYYFMPIAKFQQLVDTTTWMAAYEKGINDPNVKSEEEALYYADAQVERAQTSGLFSDRSGLERGTLGTRTRQGQFVRLWTVLISYMLAKGNIAYEKGVDTNFKDPKQVAMFLSDMVLLFAVEGMASALLYGDWPEDEDEDGDVDVISWAATATVESIASGIPMVREYSGAKYGSGTTPIGALTVDMWKSIEQLSQGELDEAAVKSVVKTTGTMFHLPASQFNRAVEAAFKEDDTDLHEWIMGVDEE